MNLFSNNEMCTVAKFMSGLTDIFQKLKLDVR